MKTFLYITTFIGGIIGTFILFGSLLAESAPQQGAGAAIAIGFTVIPYCMARVLEKARQEPLEDMIGKLLMAQAQLVRPQQPPTSLPTNVPARNPLVPHRG